MSENNYTNIDFCNSLLYDKIAEHKDINITKEVSDWFKSQESQNTITHCSKLNVKFLKKHCDILKFLNSDKHYFKSDKFTLDFKGCNPFVCEIAKKITNNLSRKKYSVKIKI